MDFYDVSVSDVVMDENHYYPFGLEHKIYTGSITKDFKEDQGNGTVVLDDVTKTDYMYKFQSQELQDELSLNWYSFKWRNYDPAMARFTAIDPLADQYPDWGAYVFRGNRVIDARELEGLEPEIMNGDDYGLGGMEDLFGSVDLEPANIGGFKPEKLQEAYEVDEDASYAYSGTPCTFGCHQTPGMDMSGGSGWGSFSIMGNHNETFNSFYTHGPGRKEPFKDPKWLRVGDKVVPVEFDFLTPGSAGRAANVIEVVAQTLELWNNVNGEGGLVDVISNQRNKPTDADDSIELRIWTNGIHQDKPGGVLRGHLGPKIYKTTRRESLKVILQVDKNNDSINNILSNQ